MCVVLIAAVKYMCVRGGSGGGREGRREGCVWV